VRVLVLDTNVLVAALLSPFGPPAQLLRLILGSRVRILLDERILAEYRDVLPRPKFRFDPEDVKITLAQLERVGILVVPMPLPVVLPDSDDLPFLEVAQTGEADWLVTGNPRHFIPVKGSHDVVVLSPSEAMKELASSLEQGS
jgi:uncharacterized protein